ncbi:LytR C-terminal domain-containing protein [Varibaculum prostatecancerukia]|uniref:LytR C-terminal domain-containing protein n=1 Tax=Varibaculum prostatecancerukia TaxID=2811781 RepID=UPI001BFFEA6A|nr:LytR C-terminal domain-containing protein [Varibaculum prostatecancerukia]
MSKQEFPEDEFDALAEEGPSGAHRRPVRRWQALLPILVVLVLGPALAWGGVALMKGTGHTQTPAATKTATTTTAATPTTSPKKIAKPSESSKKETATSPTASASATNKAEARVRVLNASNRSGWAKEVADKLAADGFTNPNASNSQARGLKDSTVLYRGSQFEAAAKEAAKVAGISNVQDADSGGYQIGETDIAIYLVR